MAANSQSASRRDPLTVFRFAVQIGNWTIFFKSVGGLRYETETLPVKAGGMNNTTFMLPNSVKWSNLVLKSGFTGNSELLAWHEDWMSPDKFPKNRMDVTITQLDSSGKPKAEWKAKNCMPVKWEVTELDASKSELSIETLELAHDGLEFKKAG